MALTNFPVADKGDWPRGTRGGRSGVDDAAPESPIPDPESRVLCFRPHHNPARPPTVTSPSKKKLISTPQKAPEDSRRGQRGISVVAQVFPIADPVARGMMVVKGPSRERHNCHRVEVAPHEAANLAPDGRQLRAFVTSEFLHPYRLEIITTAV